MIIEKNTNALFNEYAYYNLLYFEAKSMRLAH